MDYGLETAFYIKVTFPKCDHCVVYNYVTDYPYS